MNNDFKRILKTNDEISMYGDDISRLQKELYMKGYLDNNDITGYYTKETQEAILKFQSDNFMTPNGITDKNTWDLLFENMKNNFVKTIKKKKEDFSNVNNVINNKPMANRSLDVHKTKQMSIQTEPSIYALKSKQLYDGSPKHTPFFAKDNSKLLRKSNIDIKIEFGNEKEKTKIIKNGFFRNKSIVISSQGEPLYETYEFIGSDVVEVDNTYNTNK